MIHTRNSIRHDKHPLLFNQIKKVNHQVWWSVKILTWILTENLFDYQFTLILYNCTWTKQKILKQRDFLQTTKMATLWNSLQSTKIYSTAKRQHEYVTTNAYNEWNSAFLFSITLNWFWNTIPTMLHVFVNFLECEWAWQRICLTLFNNSAYDWICKSGIEGV